MSVDPHGIPELDAKGLRSFGVTTGLIVAGLFGLFFPWILDRPIPRWPWILAALLLVFGALWPTALRPVYKIWMRFGAIMNRIMTPLVMGIAFFIAITPMALIRSMMGRDSMARDLDPKVESYRVQSHKRPDKSMEKPF
jgi:intracellular septation protein A